MHRRDHKVAGLSCSDGSLGGLVVVDVRNDYDVGVLAHGALDCFGEVRSIDSDLTLSNDRKFVRVENLDWILDGDDRHGASAVDVVAIAAWWLLPDAYGPLT